MAGGGAQPRTVLESNCEMSMLSIVQGKLARPSTKLQQGVASDLPTRRDLQLTQAIGNQRFGIMLTDVTLPEDA